MNQNSKMLYLNVNIKGLNGRPHVVLDYSTNTKDVQRLHSHLKLLCNDLYTYETKATFHGGSSNCRLCKPDSPPCSNVENVNHIISECQAYSDIRNRILFQMEIVVRKSENKVNFSNIMTNDGLLTQFVLDCTSLNLPDRISPSDEIFERVLNLSRDYCYSICKKRLSLLKSKDL